MIQLPPDKFFLIKFSSEMHSRIVSRLIRNEGGEVIAKVKSLAELIERLQPNNRHHSGGIIYELRGEKNEIYLLPPEEERQIKLIRSLAGEDMPIVATYHPKFDPNLLCGPYRGESVEGLALATQRICGYGADAVLAHGFTQTQFYNALERALAAHRK